MCMAFCCLDFLVYTYHSLHDYHRGFSATTMPLRPCSAGTFQNTSTIPHRKFLHCIRLLRKLWSNVVGKLLNLPSPALINAEMMSQSNIAGGFVQKSLLGPGRTRFISRRCPQPFISGGARTRSPAAVVSLFQCATGCPALAQLVCSSHRTTSVWLHTSITDRAIAGRGTADSISGPSGDTPPPGQAVPGAEALEDAGI
jgi:hypothetical protein